MTRQERFKKYKKRCRKLGLYENEFEELVLVIPEDISTKAERISLKSKIFPEDDHCLYEIFSIVGKFVCLINIDNQETILVKPQVAIRGILSYYILCDDDIFLPKKQVKKKVEDLRIRLHDSGY